MTTIDALPTITKKAAEVQTPSDELVFVAEHEALDDALADNFIPQVNTLSGEMEALGEEMTTLKDDAELAKQGAENARDAAEATAMATQWVSLGSYTLGEVVWSPINGRSYRAKTTHSGISVDPANDFTNWYAIAYGEIDEKVSHLSITASAYTGGNLTSMTYTGGYKTLYTYSSGNLSTVQYTDTDGTTVLLTETFTYDASGNITSSTRS